MSWQVFFFFVCVCVFFLRIFLLWFKIKSGETALAFTCELCVWHFPELLSAATSKYDINVSLVDAALWYALLSLRDGKGIFKTSPFWFVIHTHPHSLLHHTEPHLTTLQPLFFLYWALCESTADHWSAQQNNCHRDKYEKCNKEFIVTDLFIIL